MSYTFWKRNYSYIFSKKKNVFSYIFGKRIFWFLWKTFPSLKYKTILLWKNFFCPKELDNYFWFPSFYQYNQSGHLGTISCRLCSTCMTYGTSCHTIGHQVLPTQYLPRDVVDFSRGSKYPKDEPLPTFLTHYLN